MTETDKSPIEQALEEWLPDNDIGVMAHGFLPHGRDYFFVIEDCLGPRPGTHRLVFTHVVDLRYVTRVTDDAWRDAWTDEFTDYQEWLDAGEPEGYVWGSNWSNAYPGVTTHAISLNAAQWTKRLGKPMHEMAIETDRFLIELVFHDLRVEKLSDTAPTVSQVTIPLP